MNQSVLLTSDSFSLLQNLLFVHAWRETFIPFIFLDFSDRNLALSCLFAAENSPLDVNTSWSNGINQLDKVWAISKMSSWLSQAVLRVTGCLCCPRSSTFDPWVCLFNHQYRSFPRNTPREHMVRARLSVFRCNGTPQWITWIGIVWERAIFKEFGFR